MKQEKITQEVIDRAREEFAKNGGLAMKFSDQRAVRTVIVGEKHGAYENVVVDGTGISRERLY